MGHGCRWVARVRGLHPVCSENRPDSVFSSPSEWHGRETFSSGRAWCGPGSLRTEGPRKAGDTCAQHMRGAQMARRNVSLGPCLPPPWAVSPCSRAVFDTEHERRGFDTLRPHAVGGGAWCSGPGGPVLAVFRGPAGLHLPSCEPPCSERGAVFPWLAGVA